MRQFQKRERVPTGLDNDTLSHIVGKELTVADEPSDNKDILEPRTIEKIVLI